MAYIAKDPESYKDTVVGTGQCVPFVQKASGAPVTSAWKRGTKVRGTSAIQKGTPSQRSTPTASTRTARMARLMPPSMSGKTQPGCKFGISGPHSRFTNALSDFKEEQPASNQ